MAGVNSIQGSLVLHEFSEDNITWKILVCAQGGKFESTTNVTTEKTKCGPVKGVDDPDWKMSGDGTANIKPDAGMVSYNDMLRWQQAKQLIYVRLQSPADDVLGLTIGQAFYHSGEMYITGVTIDNSNGAIVKFTWNAEGQGVLVTTKPAFTAAFTPSTLTQAAGTTFTLTGAKANGDAPFTYQWKKNGTAISGATAINYSKSGSATGDTGSYTLEVTDSSGAVAISAAHTVTITAPLTVSISPSTITQSAGTPFTITGTITPGTAPYTVTWKKGSSTLVTVTTSSLSPTYTPPSSPITADSGGYFMSVVDAAGLSGVSNYCTVSIT